MPGGDGQGRDGSGPESGRGLGKLAGNSSGRSSNEARPYDGRGNGQGNRPIYKIENNYGPGKNNTQTYRARNLQKQDGSGPPPNGKKLGPGKGKMDGSGLEDIVIDTKTKTSNIERYFLSNSKTYNLVSKEYSSIYYSNEKNYSNSSTLKSRIMQAHNTAVKKGYSGAKRRAYVKSQVAKYSKRKGSNTKSSSNKSSSKSSSSKSSSSSRKAA